MKMADSDKGSEKRMVPLRTGMFRVPDSPDGKPVLLGCRCPECGAYYYPKRYICITCGHEGLDEAELSGRGRVWTFSIAGQTPPGSLVEAPYAMAVIELPKEKVAIRCPLTDVAMEDVKVGMDVEIVLAKMKEDEEGNDVVSFKFKPVQPL
jgi:scaffold protein (connect acetoacetyl-CoA thiolase and HMG-CoA synthase)